VFIVFWCYCCFVCLEQLVKFIKIKLSTILVIISVFCFQHSSTEHYQYTSKDVIKLSFWVRWHVMLLMCCRLQELRLDFCWNMTDRGLLEGIGSLQELTSLYLCECSKLTAQALSTFLHRRSMSSIISLKLSLLRNLDDEGLEGIAERCNKLKYLHI